MKASRTETRFLLRPGGHVRRANTHSSLFIRFFREGRGVSHAQVAEVKRKSAERDRKRMRVGVEFACGCLLVAHCYHYDAYEGVRGMAKQNEEALVSG